MGVSVNFEIADVHRWNYPEAEFDVVVEIFTNSVRQMSAEQNGPVCAKR
jgi:hypothetical protein